MDETRTQCIIFDFGGVIGFFDFDRAWVTLSAMTNGRFDPGQIRDAIDTSGLRATYEHGEISTSTFLAAVNECLGTTISPMQIAKAWSEIFMPNRPVIDFIQKLGGRYNLVLGSNTNELHYWQFRRQFSNVLDLFSAEILSHQLHVKKPDNAFYEACIEAARCPAAACIYIDDIPEFVASARALGIKGIVYNNTLDLAEALHALDAEAGK